MSFDELTDKLLDGRALNPAEEAALVRYTAPALDAADVARLFDHLAWLDNAEAEREAL